jgi:hypothetical protein
MRRVSQMAYRGPGRGTVSASMPRQFHRLCSGVGAALVCALAISPAFGQAIPNPTPPDSMVTAPGGVDLRSGKFAFDKQDLVIADGAVGGITLKRTVRSDFALNFDAFGQFGNNWNIFIQVATSAPYADKSISVTNQGVSYNFGSGFDYSGIFLRSQTGYARLTRSVSGSTAYWSLTTATGTVVNFTSGLSAAFVLPTTISKPDGVVYTLSYVANGLQSVTSNAGYALLFEYSGSSALASKACVLNLAVNVLGSTCPAGVPTTSYSYSGNKMVTATDAVGASWTYSSTDPGYTNPYTDSYFNPGASTPYQTIAYTIVGHKAAVSRVTYADGHYYDYSWSEESYGCSLDKPDCNDKVFPLGTGYVENGTNTTSVDFFIGPYLANYAPIVSPGPQQVVDVLGRTYLFHYCGTNTGCGAATTLLSKVSPEGITESYSYDSYLHINQRVTSPKPGSGLTALTTTATYANCSSTSLVACDSPTAVVDARGNETDATYSPVHGGALSVSGPAGANGIRPVKRYAYTQRYAWILSGASYVHAASPIWVKTEERSCRATATVGNACAGGSADEVVTSYDYGPDSGPNTLLLRGTVVTADGVSLRTCYGYDSVGRRISQTQPLGTAGSCP